MTMTMTTSLLVAASEDAAVDTNDGESVASDDTSTVAEVTTATTTTTHNEEIKKERVLRKTWTLLHSFNSTGQANDTSFTPRAKVVLEIHVNDGKTNAKTTTTPSPPVLTIENHPDCLSQDSVHRMMKTQWYQLKLVEDHDDDQQQEAGGVLVPPPPILATVPACRMRLANFR
jgi:hypothetical protein